MADIGGRPVSVSEVEMFLGKLEERGSSLVRLAERVQKEADTNNITGYSPFREEVDNFKALSSIIKDRLSRMTSSRKDELEEQFHKLQVLMLKLVIKTSLKFFFVMSAKSVLPLGSRETFETELKTLVEAEGMLSDPAYENELDEEARDDLDLAKDILSEIIQHAPSLLDFGKKRA